MSVNMHAKAAAGVALVWVLQLGFMFALRFIAEHGPDEVDSSLPDVVVTWFPFVIIAAVPVGAYIFGILLLRVSRNSGIYALRFLHPLPFAFILWGWGDLAYTAPYMVLCTAAGLIPAIAATLREARAQGKP